MIHWHQGIDSDLIRNRHRFALENQSVANAAVIEIEHARVDLYEAAVKPLQNLSIGCWCVADDNTISADCGERRVQAMFFNDPRAPDVAAVPERSVHAEKRRIAKSKSRINGVQNYGILTQ